MKTLIKLILPLALLTLSGCMATGKYTVPAAQTNFVTQEDKAAIVFMRASNFGGAVTSPLVKVDDIGNTELVGILGPKEKMVYYVEPGEHQFMVIGESADFMKANVEAGKAYYAIIRPRMGVWKARFSVTPFKVAPESEEFSKSGPDLKEWSMDCAYTVPNQQATAWHESKRPEMQDLFNKYMPSWESKTSDQKAAATLEHEDGFDKISF